MIRIKFAELLGRHKMRISDLVEQNIGIHANTLYRLYNEEGKRVDFEVLEKLCEFFKCDLDELMVYDPDYKRPSK